MNRAKIQQHIMESSRKIDNKTLTDFTTLMQNRLATKRQEGRTGWELMESHEIADLMCKVINNKNGDNFYLDLANLLMFAHALELNPSDITDVLEAHLGRNWQCRMDAMGGEKVRVTKPEKLPKPMSAVEALEVATKCLPDKCEVVLWVKTRKKPETAFWSVQENEFIIPCEGGGAIGIPLREVTSYSVVNVPDEPAEQPALENWKQYNLVVDGLSCFGRYRYHAKTNRFTQVDDDNKPVKAGMKYDLDTFEGTITWERIYD